MKIIFYMLSIFACCGWANAAPSITSASVYGGTVSVTGLSFGSKSPAAPILFENFDSGTNGQGIGGWHGFVRYGGYGSTDGGTLTNVSPYSGTLSAYNHITPSSGEFNTSNYFFDPTDEIYYSYVAKFVSTGDSYGVDKWGRSNCAPNVYNGPGDITVQYSQVTFNTGTITNDNTPDDNGLNKWITTRFSNWTRHEMYKKLSTPGVANGIADFTVGQNRRVWSNYVTREAGYSFQQTNIILGLMFANARNDGDHRMYVDDVYVDKTRARVELCTGSTWTNRGTCNPQPPTTWSETSITATANTSTFSSGQTAYLYVIDADGAYNSSGYTVTVGSAAPAASMPIGAGTMPIGAGTMPISVQ